MRKQSRSLGRLYIIVFNGHQLLGRRALEGQDVFFILCSVHLKIIDHYVIQITTLSTLNKMKHSVKVTFSPYLTLK